MKSRPKGLIIKIIRSYYIWQKKKKKKRPTCIFQINYLHIFRFFVGMWTFPVCITARASEESISSEWHVVLLTRVCLFRPPTFKANSTRLIVFNFLASYATDGPKIDFISCKCTCIKVYMKEIAKHILSKLFHHFI